MIAEGQKVQQQPRATKRLVNFRDDEWRIAAVKVAAGRLGIPLAEFYRQALDLKLAQVKLMLAQSENGNGHGP